MGEVIVITSGKGGVGKTTTTANIGIGLAQSGKKVVVIDTDLGLRNLDVVMGLENRIVYNLVDVIEGSCRMKQALIRDKRFPIYICFRPHRQKTRRPYHRNRCRNWFQNSGRTLITFFSTAGRHRTGIPKCDRRSRPCDRRNDAGSPQSGTPTASSDF